VPNQQCQSNEGNNNDNLTTGTAITITQMILMIATDYAAIYKKSKFYMEL